MNDEHFIPPGNAYKKKDGDFVVVIHCLSALAIWVRNKTKNRDEHHNPSVIRQMYFIGSNYKDDF